MTRKHFCDYAFIMPDDKTIFCKSCRVIAVGDKERFVTLDFCVGCPAKSEPCKPENVYPDPELNPGILQKASNFFKASVKQAVSGFTLSKPFIEARQEVCQACPFFDKKDRYCTDRKCGCKKSLLTGGMVQKWSMSTTNCPKAYWLPVLRGASLEEYQKTAKDPKTGQPFDFSK